MTTLEERPLPAPQAGGRGARSGGKRPSIFSRIRTYVREVVSELRKVIYPSRNQLVTYTIVVVVFVAFIVSVVSGIDFGLSKLVIKVFG
ncbi:MAG TPA: preprotein translocase subunit SecE [Mycobacteriales bacterium]|nr:preprotein translocase subunit SecE [Mycobacteriales bacterium]